MLVWKPLGLSSYGSFPRHPSGGQLGRDVHRSYRCFDSGIAAVMLQDQGGGLELVSYRTCKLNSAKRGNTYSAYDLEALAVCETVKHWRYYLEGCSEFLVVTDHDTLRYLLKQPNNLLNKRQARYPRDLQPFVGSMILACRKGNEMK
jgi:hypothetical protein